MFELKFEDIPEIHPNYHSNYLTTSNIPNNNHNNHIHNESMSEESLDFFNFFNTDGNKNSQFQAKEKEYFSESNKVILKKNENLSLNNNNNNDNEMMGSVCDEQQYENANSLYFEEGYNCQDKQNLSYFQNLDNSQILQLDSQQQQRIQEDIQQLSQYKFNNCLVLKQNWLNNLNIYLINWNKLQKYIEISYNNMNDEQQYYLMEKKNNTACSDSQIDTIINNPSISNYDLQSVKNLENSITILEQTSGTQIQTTNDNLIIIQDDINKIFRKEYFNENNEINNFLYNEYIIQDLFILKENKNEQSAIPQGSILNSELIEFLGYDISSFSTQNYPLNKQPFFNFLLNQSNKNITRELEELRFSNINKDRQSQIIREEIIHFVTQDGFEFEGLVIYEIISINSENNNNETQGCIIKYHIVISKDILQQINQKRIILKIELDISTKIEDGQNQNQQEQQQNLIKKKNIIDYSSDNHERNKIKSQMKQFLYKFKYIKKQKSLKKLKREQDLYPSKTCKYRIISV